MWDHIAFWSFLFGTIFLTAGNDWSQTSFKFFQIRTIAACLTIPINEPKIIKIVYYVLYVKIWAFPTYKMWKAGAESRCQHDIYPHWLLGIVPSFAISLSLIFLLPDKKEQFFHCGSALCNNILAEMLNVTSFLCQTTIVFRLRRMNVTVQRRVMLFLICMAIATSFRLIEFILLKDYLVFVIIRAISLFVLVSPWIFGSCSCLDRFMNTQIPTFTESPTNSDLEMSDPSISVDGVEVDHGQNQSQPPSQFDTPNWLT